MSAATPDGTADDEPTAVVTATRAAHGYASVRSLGAADVRTLAAVTDPGNPVSASRYCDDVVEVPPASDLAAYREALLEVARRDDVETILPHLPQDVLVLSRHREEFDRHVDVVVPPLEVLRDVHDRLRLAEVADRAGVAAPETRPLEAVSGWDGDRVVRPRYPVLTDAYVDDLEPSESGRETRGVAFVPDGEAPDPAALRERFDHEPVVQSYVPPACEYAVGALAHRGTALATYQQRTVRTDTYEGGPGGYRVTVDEPAVERAGRALLEELAWHGPACVRFVEHAETGDLVVVDVEARLWPSLPLAVRSGADFPRWYWLHARGAVEQILPAYEVGVASHSLAGELSHLRSALADESSVPHGPSAPRAAWDVVASCARRPAFDYVHPDDPSPALRGLRNAVARAVGRRG